MDESPHLPEAAPGDELVVLQIVLTEAEGQILCDLLNSGGINAILHGTQLSGYGMITSAIHGGAGEILVHAKDVEEARNFVRMWQTPLLEESDEQPAGGD
jgi:hypothetical protein